MIVVTGGAGFIGSNLSRALACERRAEVVVVDRTGDPAKLRNLAGIPLVEVVSPVDLARILRRGDRWTARVEAVLHQGGCTDTLETDWRYVFATNVRFSKLLLDACVSRRLPFLYASSAAVYGSARRFCEEPDNERPRGLYACSKAAFDRHVRRILPTVGSPVIGLRYFNVYGTGEAHKGRMASLVYQLHQQATTSGRLRLFGGLDGCADGEQRRDFVVVGDVVQVTLWALEQAKVSGILNVGSGTATSFNQVARLVIEHCGGALEYVPLPASLRASYQLFTEADLRSLRAAGCTWPMTRPAAGIGDYLRQLSAPVREDASRPGR
jgi:ADP-L-glycero-D-manno-heptose 6-epimerase